MQAAAPVEEAAPAVEAEEAAAAPAEKSFDEMLEDSLKTIYNGDKVSGVVVAITATEVSIDLGTKYLSLIHILIIPAENEPDLDEIDQSVRERLKFVTADHLDAILDIALNRRAVAEPETAEPESEQTAQTPPPGAMTEAGARIGQ